MPKSLTNERGLAILQITRYSKGFIATVPDVSLTHDLLIPVVPGEASIGEIRREIRRNSIAFSRSARLPVQDQIDLSSAGNEPLILEALKSIGTTIYLGTNLKRAFDFLYQHRDVIDSVKIVTDTGESIPWDLAYYHEEKVFLCQIFSVGISMLDERKFERTGPTAFQLKDEVRKDDVFLIYGNDGGPKPRVGDRLSHVEQDCEALADIGRKHFPGETINLANAPLTTFLEEWGKVYDRCRILYLQGHFRNGRLYTPQGWLDHNKIAAWMRTDENRRLDRGPIVFLNGCVTTFGSLQSRDGPHYGSNERLARTLIDAGASACIMTRGPVYEGPASQFAQWVFFYLLGDRRPIGEAVRFSRSEVGRLQDPLWQSSGLLYTLYGNPMQSLWNSDRAAVTESRPIRLHSLTDIDAREYYEREDFDPFDNFNRIEITLSHIFREPSQALGMRTFSEAMLSWMEQKGLIIEEVVEIGAGLGHIALNLMRALRDRNKPVRNYQIVDVSRRLMDEARALLAEDDDLPVIFHRQDARELPFQDSSVEALVLCVGVLADLHSILMDGRIGQPVRPVEHPNASTYAILLELQGEQVEQASQENFYLSIGAFDFLVELARVMKKGSCAIIGEYRWTQRNAVTDFGTHQECPVRFEHLRIIAEHYGFEVQEFDVAEVLGLDLDTKFLSMDFFTQKELFDFAMPQLDLLRRSGYQLPVKAYTRPELETELKQPKYGLTPHQTNVLIKGLDPYFFRIDDPEFDSLHPETWHYSFLLLRRL